MQEHQRRRFDFVPALFPQDLIMSRSQWGRRRHCIDEIANLLEEKRWGAAVNMKLEFNTFLEGDEQFRPFTTYPSENASPSGILKSTQLSVADGKNPNQWAPKAATSSSVKKYQKINTTRCRAARELASKCLLCRSNFIQNIHSRLSDEACKCGWCSRLGG